MTLDDLLSKFRRPEQIPLTSLSERDIREYGRKAGFQHLLLGGSDPKKRPSFQKVQKIHPSKKYCYSDYLVSKTGEGCAKDWSIL